MRWSCPHCGVNLAVADEKLGAGWSFSRCYKCGGFALVRRAEVNLVKVDRAPAGEQILLPEASEDPATMLGNEAQKNLMRYRKENAERAAARPPAHPMANAMAENPPNTNNIINNSAIDLNRMGETILPPPLPEITRRRPALQRLLPIAIGATATIAIGSGTYLYLQGQQLWEKARNTAAVEIAKPVIETASIAAPAPVEVELAATKNAVSDQLRQNAMAPVREEPIAESIAEPVSTASLVVQPKANNAKFRSGPGTLYPESGSADASQRYVVADWNDRWFKVVLKGQLDAKGMPQTAWIRTDMVKVVPVRDGETLPEFR